MDQAAGLGRVELSPCVRVIFFALTLQPVAPGLIRGLANLPAHRDEEKPSPPIKFGATIEGMAAYASSWPEVDILKATPKQTCASGFLNVLKPLDVQTSRPGKAGFIETASSRIGNVLEALHWDTEG